MNINILWLEYSQEHIKRAQIAADFCIYLCFPINGFKPRDPKTSCTPYLYEVGLSPAKALLDFCNEF